MYRKVKFALILCLALLWTSNAQAQRTARGMYLVSSGAVSDFSSAGTELSFGRYLLSSYMAGGVILNHTGFLANGERSVFLSTEVFYDWMYRLMSSRNRELNLYVGSDLFGGLEILDPYYRLLPETYKGLENNGFVKSSFIYGVSPRIELEWFLSTCVALTFDGRLAVTLGSQRQLPLSCLCPTLSFGARVIF